MYPVYSSRCVLILRRVREHSSGIHIASLILRSDGPFHVRNHWSLSEVLAQDLSSAGSLLIAASFCAVLAPFEYTS